MFSFFRKKTNPAAKLSDGHSGTPPPEPNPLASMLGRNLAQLQQDPASRKAVRREWLKYFEQHPIADLRHYYTFLFPILQQAAAQQWQQWQGLDEFAALFAQRKFIAERYDNTRQTGEVLAQYGAQLAEHLAAATAAPLPPESRAANWLGSLLDLYFHHSTHDQPENFIPAAALVRPYLQRFPEQYSSFFESYLEQAPDPIAAFAALLALGAQNRQDYCLSQMFGDGDTDSYPYQNAAAILKAALPQCDAAQTEILQQQVLEEFDLTENGADDTADTRPGLIKWLKRSRPVRENIRLLAEAAPDTPAAATLRGLLPAAKPSKPAKAAKAAPPQTPFRDTALKLAVIDELMYRQNTLAPRLNFDRFAADCETRVISRDTDGYAPVPEILDYFTRLDIPPEMLATVEELHIEDGCSPLYAELWPYYDPGCDQMLPITQAAAADLPRLPHLKRITGLENLNPPPALLAELQKSGIRLATQEEYDEEAD
ncbi:DUF6892 domain-containing protein [Neisseria sp. 23W00296]|uniref:DUF6892 domain-containing protein n=1 Tax=unclassified Neisseria TaxID=2623750 RepID=UPI00375781BA